MSTQAAAYRKPIAKAFNLIGL